MSSNKLLGLIVYAQIDDERWAYNFQNVRPKKYLEELGRNLYCKIAEVIQAEFQEFTMAA